VLTLLKSWVRPDTFHAVLNERSVRWYNARLGITRDADLAADAVQEALLEAWNHREEFRGAGDRDGTAQGLRPRRPGAGDLRAVAPAGRARLARNR
jgi:hypothetical protein